MNTIKPYNHTDEDLAQLQISYHSNNKHRFLHIYASDFCENPKEPKHGRFGIRDANEQVIKIMPHTLNISDDYLKSYHSEDHCSKGEEYCAYWKKNSQPYAIWGFHSKYRNYFPDENTTIYGLRLDNKDEFKLIYYWIDSHTLVVQNIDKFKTLKQFIENRPVVDVYKS